MKTKNKCNCECGSPYCRANTCTHTKVEKLDLVKVRKEMYRPTAFDWEQEDLIREIVAKEINLMENKINEIIDTLNSRNTKE